MTKDFSKSINRFTHNVNAIISLNNISKQEFFDDINKIKPKGTPYKWFKDKYIELFNGTFSKYKSKESFLGSYRRNINPIYYNQSGSKKVIKFNQELRFDTIHKEKIQKKVKKKFKLIKTETKVKATSVKYDERIGYRGFARIEVSHLKETWELNKVIKNNLFASQEIQFRIKYDLVDSNGNVIYKDQWITVRSNISSQETNLSLLYLYDYAYRRLIEYMAKLEQSKLFIKLKLVCTYVIRKAE